MRYNGAVLSDSASPEAGGEVVPAAPRRARTRPETFRLKASGLRLTAFVVVLMLGAAGAGLAAAWSAKAAGGRPEQRAAKEHAAAKHHKKHNRHKDATGIHK